MIEDDIIGALKLRSTYYRDAPKERGIIPQGFEAGYNYSLGQANAYVMAVSFMSQDAVMLI